MAALFARCHRPPRRSELDSAIDPTLPGPIPILGRRKARGIRPHRQRSGTLRLPRARLSAAVAEYKRRHGLPLPPNFDKWYDYAVKTNSLVIDDYGQIFNDLLPFWGVEPSLIRASTARLTSHAGIEMGALSIQNGTVKTSPHVPGTHRWMTDAIEKMIEPFARWLPDMVLAVNLADECRVAVPFEDMEALKATARVDSRSKVGKSKQAGPASNREAWRLDFPEPMPWDRKDSSDPRRVTRLFRPSRKPDIL